MELAEGDYVLLRSPDGQRTWRYEGTGKGQLGLTEGFWAMHFPGDRLIIELHSRNVEGLYGYRIDRYARGFLPEEMASGLGSGEPEGDEFCGPDDSEWARCYEGTEIYDKSRTVARLLIHGTGHCTGWLVGSEGHLMTNNHCIASINDAVNTNYEFLAEGTDCETACDATGACSGALVADTADLIQTNSTIDYTLLELPSNPTANYGYLQMREDGGVLGEQVYLPQHPLGWGKRIAVSSTEPEDTSGFVELRDTYVFTHGDGTSTTQWLYCADRQPGASGGPILASADHRVVALHSHAHGDPLGNGGSMVELIIEDLGANLPNSAVSYDLTVNHAGSGSGSVSSNPAGINCGLDCEESYGNGSVVSLNTSPSAGSIWTHWSGDSECDDGVVTMNSHTSCTAHFSVAHPLIIVKAGAGSGTVTSVPGGIDCGPDCVEQFAEDTVVTLTPSSAADSRFVGWSGDPDCSDGVVTMDSFISCTATFEIDSTLQVTKSGTGSGVIVSSPPGIECGVDCSHTFPPGTEVTLAVTPDQGSSFAGWKGDEDCSEGVVTLNGPVSCEAVCNLVPRILAVVKIGSGAGEVTSIPTGIDCGATCQSSFDYGAQVTLIDSAGQGSVFAGWTGDEDCQDGTVTLDADLECVATFDLQSHLLAVALSGVGTCQVTSDPAGIECEPDCQKLYDHGTSVVLTATPEPGSAFIGWSGDADCLDGLLTMESDLSCVPQCEPTSDILFRDGFENEACSSWAEAIGGCS